MKRSLLASLLIAGSLSACGDVSSVRLGVVFVEPEVEARAEALQLVVQTVPSNPATACSNFVAGRNTSLEGNDVTLAYPLDGDVIALPVDITLYEELTFIVLAFPSGNTEDSAPIAGACEVIPTTSDGAIESRFVLETL